MFLSGFGWCCKEEEVGMQVIYQCCCGLDVHKKVIVACLLMVRDKEIHRDIQRFGTTYQELRRLEAWLQQAGCSHVAMESTGVYWCPIFNVLEESCEQVIIVNAQHIKAVPGRKTDVKDAQWIAELFQHGLLRPSFIPPRPQRELRGLTRGRKQFIEERSRVINRVQKILEDTNVKLSSVVSDITGKSALKMLHALLEGHMDVKEIAALAHSRMKATQEELEQALSGRLTDHHRFLLGQALKHLEALEGQIADFDQEIARHIEADWEPDPPNPPQDTSSERSEDGPPSPSPETVCDGRPSSEGAWAVQLLDGIPGISTRLAQVLVAEIGTDMTHFASEHHLASWAGVCPGSKISAGKRLSSKTTKGNRYVRDALVEAARAAANTKGTFLGAFYRRLKGRIGGKKAVMALAHRILVIIYHMLKDREAFQEYGEHATDDRLEESRKRRAIRQLETLGYQVQLQHVESA
jgi:transposase